MEDKIFVSYSWDSEAHRDRVRSFTNELRKVGFNAEMDDSIRQKETAIDFIKMIHTYIPQSKKVVIVLSEGYKVKATNFSHGVGSEYILILKDIDRNPNKYILVSFSNDFMNLAPPGLEQREVVSLSKPEAIKLLHQKLNDSPQFNFAEVGAVKPVYPAEEISPFSLSTNHSLEATGIAVFTDSSSKQGGLFTHFQRLISVEIKNVSSTPVNDFSVVVKIPSFLVPDSHKYDISDENVLFEMNGSKLFPNQTTKSQRYAIAITRFNIQQAMTAEIVVSIFSDSGQLDKSFRIIDLIKLPTDYGSTELLSEDKFGGW